jgi:glycosyltransferase involved in cell wall biosynthesis
MNISVIIPTINRATTLILTRESLVTQSFPVDEYEILIVDNGSRDRTKTVCENLIAQYQSHQIRYFYEPSPGVHAARHGGVLEAKGDILAFVDDDIETDVDWLQGIADSFSDPTVKLVGGRNLPKYEVQPPAWLDWFWHDTPYGKACPHLSLMDFGDRVLEIDANYIWSQNLAISKQTFLELGGFHPDNFSSHLQHFQGDGETGLARKLKRSGYKAIYQPKAKILHQVSQSRITYDYFDRRFFSQGISDSFAAIRKNGGQLEKVRLKQKLVDLQTNSKYSLKLLKRKFDRQNLPERPILKERFNLAHQAGYNFHQTAVSKNPHLLEWVLKPDYLEYQIPNLSMNLFRKKF